MSKHITDHHKPGDETSRLKHFTEVERTTGRTGPHPATAELQQRPKKRSGVARLKAFLRIDRGGQS